MSNQISRYAYGPKIYNIFPRLAGTIKNWLPHMLRASDMGFNWIYINPIHPTGSSGSLYAIKDHFAFNSLFFPAHNSVDPACQLKRLIREADRVGLRLIMDLVINHTSIQSPLVHEHPNWYKKDEQGRLVNPGAMDKGKMVYWRDLAEIDNSNSDDRDALWSYWLSVARYYIDLGFKGFRCDAAYQVPSDLWYFLIKKIKSIDPDITFFGETLGCTVKQTLDVANSGFDYIFNSFKWWDLQEPWFLDQHKQTYNVVASISFAESHDTKRLASELKDDISAIKQHYIISALITKGVMITIGFEFGFHKRLNVKFTTNEDWEESRFDISGFIRKVHDLKSSYRVFNQETPIEIIPGRDPNPDIIILLKTAENMEKCLLIINKSNTQSRSLKLDLKDILPGGNIKDVSVEDAFRDVPHNTDINLMPCQVKIFYQPPR